MLKVVILRKAIVLLSCCWLVACGGSDPAPAPVVPPVVINNVPLLTGALNYSVQAQQSQVVTLAYRDADQDAVVVSFKDKPDWVQATVNQGQITLKLQPTTADVKNHAFVLQLSDGKSQQDFMLTVAVTAQPVNQAPQLSGPLSFSLTAMQQQQVSLALVDAEKDAVTVSFTNKPDWILTEQVAGRLLLTLKPGLNDVQTHAFQLRLSDGQQQRDYALSVEVKAKSANRAPQLSGDLSFDLAANSRKVLTYSVTDADHDELSVSFSGKPDWIKADFSANQLTLTLTPGYFDIKNHQFSVMLNDGQQQSSFVFEINVVDDPQRWVMQDMSAGQFIGQWQLDEQEQLYIWPNKTGIYLTAAGDVIEFNWQSHKNYLQLTTLEQACAKDCQRVMELFSIAGENHRRRFVLEQSLQAKSYQAVRQQQVNLPVGSYMALDAEWAHIKAAENSLQIGLFSPVALYTGGSSAWFDVSLPLVRSGTEVKIGDLSAPLSTQKGDFQRNDLGGRYETLEFDIYLAQATLLPAKSGLPVLSYQFAFKLKQPVSQPERYTGLSQVLDKQPVLFKSLKELTPVAPPQPELNQSYTAELPLKIKQAAAGFDYITPELQFTSAQQGKAIHITANTRQRLEQPFDWKIENQLLVLTTEAEEYRFRFSRNLKQELLIYQENGRTLSPFVKVANLSLVDKVPFVLVENISLSSGKYFEHFLSTGKKTFNTIYSDQPDTYYANLWRPESDGSITVLDVNNCPQQLDFSGCEAWALQQKASGNEVIMRYENVQLLQQNADAVLLKHRRTYIDAKGARHAEWLLRRVLLKP